MAENTLQYDWIVKITGGVRRLFAKDPNVFVAGDLFWYPVEGHPEIRLAPDTMVVFGRPPGHRGSYRQWEEGGIAPQVVFEVLSPSNRAGEMSAKFDFYQKYGVEEYYVHDPNPNHFKLTGYLRQGDDLVKINTMDGYVSPRLTVKFEMHEDGLHLIGPDGREFNTFEEVVLAEELASQRAQEAEKRAEQVTLAEGLASQRAQEAEKRAEHLQAELDRLRREGQL
jgi:hypothetical protein